MSNSEYENTESIAAPNVADIVPAETEVAGTADAETSIGLAEAVEADQAVTNEAQEESLITGDAVSETVEIPQPACEFTVNKPEDVHFDFGGFNFGGDYTLQIAKDILSEPDETPAAPVDPDAPVETVFLHAPPPKPIDTIVWSSRIVNPA